VTTKKLTKLLALYLPYILLGLVATNIGEAWRLAEGKELGDKIMAMMGTVPVAFANPLPSLHPLDLLVGLCCGAGLRLAVYLRGKNAKKYRHGMEYGSARWGTAKDIEPFMAPKFADNIILTKTERLMMSNRPPDPKNARNKNVLVVGGSGSGKTRFWLKPNLLQCHSSYVVTDPKGSIVVECGNALLKNGYKLKILNTINFKKSMHYNPFAYVHSEKDILKLVTTLMTNTKGEGSGGDPFWEKSERLLLTALIAYLHYEAPVEEQNFATLLEMLNTMQVLEDDEEYQNPVDLLFEELAKKKPNSFAGRQYKLYKLAAGKTAKSILISCGARLAPFDIQELRDLTMYDELQLDTLGDKKTALFLIMSDTDSTFNFLISMVYTQLFNLLCDKADDVYGGKLPIHVRCLIDECANIGQIPNLEKLVATIRSREISACLVLQARSQLKAIYKDNADTIVGNMDSQIFLGGSEPTTLKDLSEMLGKETIDAFNTSDTRGNSPSYGTTFQKMGHELLSRDELAVLDGGKCILQLRGVRPFLSDKYDLTQHPNYKLTSDYDPKNTFDIEKYLNRKEKINPNDEFVVIDGQSCGSRGTECRSPPFHIGKAGSTGK
jgi:type IV secretion system protein VirD4